MWRTAGHMDLLLTAPASRMKGLEFIVKSEKGDHLSMDLLQLHKVRLVAAAHLARLRCSTGLRLPT